MAFFTDLTPERVEEIITASSRIPVTRFEFINRNGRLYKDIRVEVIDGTVKAELKNGIRRTTDITIRNFDEVLIPQNNDSDIWFTKSFRLLTGFEVDGVEYLQPQGVFQFGNPDFNSQSSSDVVNNNCL